MINPASLEEEWIRTIARKQKSDPILVEKVIRALYLLELLQQSELPFIFKGGTALMLMQAGPKRFSIDIDIIVSEKPKNMEQLFTDIIEKSDFIEYKADKRQSKSKIEKAHYKFYYKPTSNSRAKSEYILLDILYEASHYGVYTQKIAIKSPFVKTDEPEINVMVPLPEAILGDKLTAYAPNTTGIPYGVGKEVEIIKQLFDVGHLFNMTQDLRIIAVVFKQFAKTELAYRAIKGTPDNVLEDIIQTGTVICTRGKSGEGDFNQLQQGIKNIRNFIFSERFHIERAITLAAKASYLAALIKKGGSEIKRFTDPSEIAEWIIEQPFETRLNKLKKSNPEAFFYWYQTTKLMAPAG